MLLYIILAIVVVLVVMSIIRYYNSEDTSVEVLGPTSTPVETIEDTIEDTEKNYILKITEYGASLVEKYQIIPRLEKYIQEPNIIDCYAKGATQPSYCKLHNIDTRGLAVVYDLNAMGLNYDECLGGGHDCWYMEKFSQDGTLIDLVDKNDFKLLDKMADDLWSNKWNMDGEFVSQLKQIAEFKDDRLVAKRPTLTPTGRTVAVGEQLTVADFNSPFVYYTTLLVSLKIAGKPKPSEIVIRVRGGKGMFDKRIQRRSDAL